MKKRCIRIKVEELEMFRALELKLQTNKSQSKEKDDELDEVENDKLEKIDKSSNDKEIQRKLAWEMKRMPTWKMGETNR